MRICSIGCLLWLLWSSALMLYCLKMEGKMKMNGENIDPEVSQKISRLINFLGDSNRSTRKRGLDGLKNELYNNSLQLDMMKIIYKEVQGAVIKLIADPVEKCRELAITIVEKYLEISADVDAVLPYMVPNLVQRLGQQEVIEPSEELRLQLSELTTSLVQLAKKKNALYLDDCIKILQRTLVDPFYEVRKEACKCASILAQSIPEHFHQQSESLIKPLLHSVSHQHSKVRIAVVNAIGQVLLYGNNKNVDDVVSHLAQRLFDQNPAVREAVTRLAGNWLLELPDRYSFWHKIMPLLLTSLTDELPSIQEEAASLWHDVGIRYLRENENDMKEKEDFEAPQPAHYPTGVERPNLGCRELMFRNQSKILPGLSRDILDWVVDTRKKSAALLYTIVINAEASITQHISMLMESLYKAAIDDEKEVVQYVEKSCEMLGYFVRPDVWVPIVLSAVEKYQHFGSILALSNLIKGSEKEKLVEHIGRICEVMSNPEVCTTRQVNVQFKVVDYVNSILSLYTVGVLEPIPASYDLFKTLISVISVAREEDVVVKANASLKELSTVQGIEMSDLFKQHTLQLLDSFGESYIHWTNHSVERLIFDTLLIYSGPVVGELLDKIIPMLTSNMNPEKDAEVRLKLFNLVSRLVQNAAQTLNSTNRFGEFSVILVTDMILPNCVWKAGRTAAAIRATALSCLWSLLKNQTISQDQLLSVAEELLTRLLTLLEDDLLDTRLITCRVIMHMLNIAGSAMEQHRLYNMYPSLLKRLDDSNDNVRIAVAKTLESYFKSFSGNYDASNYRPHFEELVKGLLIHLDDPNPEIQEAVQGVLEKAAHIREEVVIKEIESVVHKHRTPKYCNALLRYCENLKSTSANTDS